MPVICFPISLSYSLSFSLSLSLSQVKVLFCLHSYRETLHIMASSRPTQEGWFLERGDNHGLNSIFFSNRAFVDPAVHVPSGAPQEDTSHYACPRTPSRSLHSWGTYSPPPQTPGLNPRDPNPGDVSPAGAAPVKPPRQRYHAHTLPLPRRGLAVFRPW